MIQRSNGWPTSEQLLLLRAALSSAQEAKEAWSAWRERINFDEIDPASHSLLPLISRNIDLKHEPLFQRCKGVYRHIWVSNRIHWERILLVLTQLQKEGVDQIVLLKGMAMTLQYYRDFGVRPMGDIDILVDRVHLPLIDRFLLSAGWKPKFSRFDMSNPDYVERRHALNYTLDRGLNLDVHWRLIQESSLEMDRTVLRDAKKLDWEGIILRVPEPGDLLLQACLHGTKYSPIPLIRWVADAVTLLRSAPQDVDWGRLETLAKQARVCYALATAFEFLTQQFQAPIPQETIRNLQSAVSLPLERFEYVCNERGYPNVAAWHRYCMNQGHLTLSSRLRQIPEFLRVTARLRSFWAIPFYGMYWMFKRVFGK
jgi:hypothetical protein